MILLSPSHKEISNFASGLRGMVISTKHPPRLISEALPHMLASPRGRTSTGTSHLKRGVFRRSPRCSGRKLSVSPSGRLRCHRGRSGVRFSNPTCPSVAVPGCPIHLTRKWAFFSPQVSPMISSPFILAFTPLSFAPLRLTSMVETRSEKMRPCRSVPKNAYRELHRHPRLAALAHPLLSLAYLL